MKLPKGTYVRVKGKKYEGEIPDDLVPKEMKANQEKRGKTPEKPKQTEKDTKK